MQSHKFHASLQSLQSRSYYKPVRTVSFIGTMESDIQEALEYYKLTGNVCFAKGEGITDIQRTENGWMFRTYTQETEADARWTAVESTNLAAEIYIRREMRKNWRERYGHDDSH